MSGMDAMQQMLLKQNMQVCMGTVVEFFLPNFIIVTFGISGFYAFSPKGRWFSVMNNTIAGIELTTVTDPILSSLLMSYL